MVGKEIVSSSGYLDPQALITEDAFGDGRVRLRQPKSKTYRAGMDAVMLAAALQPKPKEVILDVGAGVGTVGILALKRCVDIPFSVTAFEIDPFLSQLSEENAELNSVSSVLYAVTGDVAAPPSTLKEKKFDQVITNPPFYEGHDLPPDAPRARARHPVDISFQDWMIFCLKRLKPGGVLSTIFPSARLGDMMHICAGRAGGIRIIPLWSKQGDPAKRLIFQAIKGSRTSLILCPGVILHNADGTLTKEAQKILRELQELA